MFSFSSKMANWLVPIVFVLILTPFTPYLDLRISEAFYSPESGSFEQTPFLLFWYTYGEWPSWVGTSIALILLIGSFFKKKWLKWRTPALIMILTFILGAGLITNAFLKGYWGRPRPRQIEAFGGTYPFYPYYIPNFKGDIANCKSFACGHCTTGFYFLSLVVIGRRMKNPALIKAGWILGLGLGITLSYIRIAQGGHFFSDTLLSALIMWLSALACDAIFSKKEDLSHEGSD